MNFKMLLPKIKKLYKIWTKETPSDEIPNEPDTKIIISIESLTLFLRYLTLIIVLVGYTLDFFSQRYFLSIFLICIIIHILFTHMVFYFKTYPLFSNPINFFLHLFTITTSVVVTGKEYSPLILFYPLFTLANLIYTRKKPRPFAVTLVSLILLNFTIIGIWIWEGIEFATYYLFWKNFMIILASFFCYFILNYITNIRRQSYYVQQELLYTQGIIKSILDSIQTPILIFNENEIIVDTNTYASQFFQIDSSELIGKRIRSLFFDDTVIGEYFLSLRTQRSTNFSALIISSTGEEIPIDFTVQVFFQNQKKYFFGILVDKREHKRLEEISQLLHKREEEINNKIALLKDLQSGVSIQYTAKIFTYITTLKNTLHLILHEQLGVITERQKNLLSIGFLALEQLETELLKELKTLTILYKKDSL